MNKKFIFVLMILLAVTLACAMIPSAIESAPANVGTVVAATFQALTASVPGANPAPDSASQSATDLLSHAMYFLNNDSAGLAQVYRLEKDGKTVKQVTFEVAEVEYYDVSMKDGSVAYVSNNQLLIVNADGSNRRMLLDGGAVDENSPYLNNISNPVFSPNNETIAYGHKGLNFYSLVTGKSNRVLEDVIEDAGNGFLFPREMFRPEQYTADGSKLLITLGYYEGASAVIYYPSSNALVRLNGVEGTMICCGETEWAPDGSMFYAASPTSGMFSAGLWRVDAVTGKVTTLFSGSYDTNPAEVADEPFLAPNGNLYFFYAAISNAGEFINRPPLQLVRSKMDGVTNRTILRPETYENMNESLWALDGSFVIAAIAQTPDSYQGGAAQLVYTDGQKGVLSLVPYATKMKWGP